MSESLSIIWKNMVKIENYHSGGPRGNPLPEMIARFPMALRKEHGLCSTEVLQSMPNFQVSL